MLLIISLTVHLSILKETRMFSLGYPLTEYNYIACCCLCVNASFSGVPDFRVLRREVTMSSAPIQPSTPYTPSPVKQLFLPKRHQ